MDMNLIWNKVMISKIIVMTWQSLAGVYCSMIIGVLQISSTTRNLVPRFKGWSKGEDSGRTELNKR